MATTTSSSRSPATADTASHPRIPSNPTPLSAPQEQQVRLLYYERVRQKCAKEIEDFAACARSHTFSVTFRCRPQKLTMNHCMLQYQNQTEMDAARAEWFTQAAKRKHDREERARMQEEAKRKHHEWWGLDEQGRTRALAEAEARARRDMEGGKR